MYTLKLLKVIIVDLPTRHKATRCKWVYILRFKASGSLVIYKARLVVSKGGTHN